MKYFSLENGSTDENFRRTLSQILVGVPRGSIRYDTHLSPSLSWVAASPDSLRSDCQYKNLLSLQTTLLTALKTHR